MSKPEIHRLLASALYFANESKRACMSAREAAAGARDYVLMELLAVPQESAIELAEKLDRVVSAFADTAQGRDKA